LLSLFMVEGGVRARQWWYYGSAETLDKAYRDDEKNGLRVPVANYESRSTKINSMGFRGPEITVPKPEGTIRIAFIGASTTYCAEASGNDKVWPHLVWKKIQETYPDVPMDYVNAGIPGLSVTASLKDLRQRVKPLHPDIFIIYHASNDMSWETRQLAKEQGLFKKVDETDWLGRHSLFWFLAEKNFRLWTIQRQAQSGIDHLRDLPPTFGLTFEKSLLELIHEAQDQGGLVAVATWSQQMRDNHTPAENLKAASSSLYYMPYMTPRLLLQGFRIYNQVITKVAQVTGSILIGGEDTIPGDPQHFNDSIHFTDAGNQRMAERVIQTLLMSETFQQRIKSDARPASR
ncbi:MAG TPA: SGNH/GDSL hydrolase family protein, partial [Magnetococcales bacterium]|nr:SGNH/GDSL hydrolase family protein [Magnetococcales bacterium]